MTEIKPPRIISEDDYQKILADREENYKITQYHKKQHGLYRELLGDAQKRIKELEKENAYLREERKKLQIALLKERGLGFTCDDIEKAISWVEESE